MPPTKARLPSTTTILRCMRRNMLVRVAPQPGAGVKHVDPHAGLCQRRDEGGRQVGRAVTVNGDVDLHATPRRAQQRRVQGQADFVFKQDEGFQQYLVLGCGNALKHPREIGLAIDQQRSPGCR